MMYDYCMTASIGRFFIEFCVKDYFFYKIKRELSDDQYLVYFSIYNNITTKDLLLYVNKFVTDLHFTLNTDESFIDPPSWDEKDLCESMSEQIYSQSGKQLLNGILLLIQFLEKKIQEEELEDQFTKMTM